MILFRSICEIRKLLNARFDFKLNCLLVHKTLVSSNHVQIVNNESSLKDNHNVSSKQQSRLKSNKSRRRNKEDDFSDDSDEEQEDFIAGKGAEIKNCVVGSMRLDLLIKMGLGLARNKVEEAFYESKIRLNSRKVFKKSAHVSIGDELDLIKGPAPENPKFIAVGRLEILHAKPRDEDSIEVKIRRSKNLIIENYPDGDPWKPSEGNTAQ